MSEASAKRDTTGRSRRKKWILFIAAVAVLAAGGAAATQMYLRSVGENADAAGQARFRATTARPSFVPLEQFTVNLADEGGERFAQVALTLEVADDETGAAIKARMPSVRNAILMLLSSKHTAELLTVEGKQQLASQITLRTGAQLGWQAPADRASAAGNAESVAASDSGVANPVRAVHFSHFIVQ